MYKLFKFAFYYSFFYIYDMNKSETNTILLLAASILAIISLSYLFEKKSKRTFSSRLDEDGFETDQKNFEKDYSNIGSDMRKAEKNFLNVV